MFDAVSRWIMAFVLMGIVYLLVRPEPKHPDGGTD